MPGRIIYIPAIDRAPDVCSLVLNSPNKQRELFHPASRQWTSGNCHLSLLKFWKQFRVPWFYLRGSVDKQQHQPSAIFVSSSLVETSFSVAIVYCSGRENSRIYAVTPFSVSCPAKSLLRMFDINQDCLFSVVNMIDNGRKAPLVEIALYPCRLYAQNRLQLQWSAASTFKFDIVHFIQFYRAATP